MKVSCRLTKLVKIVRSPPKFWNLLKAKIITSMFKAATLRAKD